MKVEVLQSTCCKLYVCSCARLYIICKAQNSQGVNLIEYKKFELAQFVVLANEPLTKVLGLKFDYHGRQKLTKLQ